MALLDRIYILREMNKIVHWSNGTSGMIIRTFRDTFAFVEHHPNSIGYYLPVIEYKEWETKCPDVAFGFVVFWIKNRKHKTNYLEKIGLVDPENRGKKPREIFDLYIHNLKEQFLEDFDDQPDSWRYSAQEKEQMFYDKKLSRENEEELIKKSEPLLSYLDEDDIKEFRSVMSNYLDYVSSIIEKFRREQDIDQDQLNVNVREAVQVKRIKPRKEQNRQTNYATASYTVYDETEKNLRINIFAKACHHLGYTSTIEHAKWFTFFSGSNSKCDIHWMKPPYTATYLIKKLGEENIIRLGSSSVASLVTKQLSCQRVDYRDPSPKDISKVEFLISILDGKNDIKKYFRTNSQTIDDKKIQDEINKLK